jgi:hypothetical protein
MPRGRSLGKFLPLLLFFLLPVCAAANPTDSVTYDFTVSATCSICTTFAMTGQFTFDSATDSVVGPWSFSAFGEDFMSSSDPGSYAQFLDPGFLFVDPNFNFAGSDFSVFLFAVPPFQGDIGALNGVDSCVVGCNLIASPEPASKDLGVAGLLAFALLALVSSRKRASGCYF